MVDVPPLRTPATATRNTQDKIPVTTPSKAPAPHANQAKRAIEVLESADEEVEEVTVMEKGLMDKDVLSVKGDGKAVGGNVVRIDNLVIYCTY